MAPSLPAEILRIIIKHAVTREQGYAFGPVLYDYSCIQGFINASPEFAGLVASLPEDRIYVHALGPSQLERLKDASSAAAWFVPDDQ